MSAPLSRRESTAVPYEPVRNFVTLRADPAGRAMQHIVPSPLFVDSALTPGIQIADRFAYVLRLYEENQLQRQGIVGDPYLATIKRYARIVWSRTRNYDRGDGFIIHGISRISAAKFDYALPAAMAMGSTDDEAGVEPVEPVPPEGG